MNAGDTIRIHFFVASAVEGWHVNVTDLTTGHSGTVVLNSKYGPMLPAFSRQEIGNALGWGIVDDTPNSFVWEIGHTSPFTRPASEFCLPGETGCDSYDSAHWLGFSPLRITSVTFANGSTAKKWAVVSDFGGTAEVEILLQLRRPVLQLPVVRVQRHGFGVHLRRGLSGYEVRLRAGGQFATTPECGGPFGADSTYCDTVLRPAP